jgi:hypothetical protein
MDIEDQISLEHLLFRERRCKVCGELKDILEHFYIIRKTKQHLPSSYSYECKDCTVKRIMSMRKQKPSHHWEYPDW